MRILAALMMTLLATATCKADSTHTVDGDAPLRLQQALPGLLDDYRVPGVAIARIENGRLAWTAVAGERTPGQPLTEDTVFNVASLTKPVFALMALHLVADGELSLDHRLAEDWIDPDVADDPRHQALTPRMVLSHQTGFPNWRGDEPLRFAFAPGTRHEYSGEGFEYLRRAIERHSDRSMSELMQSTILGPLSMQDTGFGWQDRFVGRTPTGFRSSGQTYQDQLDHRQPNAAANMLSTVGDYGRFAAWVARGADLPSELFDTMQQPQALHPDPAERFGLGWRLLQADGETVLSHDGREPGVRTQVFVTPATGEGLVILTSSDNGELLTRPLLVLASDNGAALTEAIDRDVWTYLQRMPEQQIEGVARMVAGSAGFMSRLLHAANTAAMQTGLQAGQRLETQEAIDAYVRDMLDGHVDPAQAAELVGQLLTDDDGTTRWRDALDSEQRDQWLAALEQRVEGRATRAGVEVDGALLDNYAGDYRMPSSQMLIQIRRADNGLQAMAEGMPVITLHADSPTLFFIREDDTRFEFQRDEDGRVSGLRAIWAGGRSEVAPRID